MYGGVEDCPTSTPLLKFGTFGPALIYKEMEKPVFSDTMTWADYKEAIGAATKDFWDYETKEGKKGWMSTTKVGDIEIVINVARAIIDRFEDKSVITNHSDLRISSVVWPNANKSALVLHKVGADTVSF
jgi:hypothetical protein